MGFLPFSPFLKTLSVKWKEKEHWVPPGDFPVSPCRCRWQILSLQAVLAQSWPSASFPNPAKRGPGGSEGLERITEDIEDRKWEEGHRHFLLETTVKNYSGMDKEGNKCLLMKKLRLREFWFWFFGKYLTNPQWFSKTGPLNATESSRRHTFQLLHGKPNSIVLASEIELSQQTMRNWELFQSKWEEWGHNGLSQDIWESAIHSQDCLYPPINVVLSTSHKIYSSIPCFWYVLKLPFLIVLVCLIIILGFSQHNSNVSAPLHSVTEKRVSALDDLFIQPKWSGVLQQIHTPLTL
jgi:hypothetical protein